MEHPRALEIDQKVHVCLSCYFCAAVSVRCFFLVNPDSGYCPDAESKCSHFAYSWLPRCVSIHAHRADGWWEQHHQQSFRYVLLIFFMVSSVACKTFSLFRSGFLQLTCQRPFFAFWLITMVIGNNLFWHLLVVILSYVSICSHVEWKYKLLCSCYFLKHYISSR